MKTDVHSTAAGNVLLAHLDHASLEHIVTGLSMRRVTEHTITDKEALSRDLRVVKSRGYALNLQEHVVGMHAVAVPILNHDAQCVASISVACATRAVSRTTLETEVLHKLRDAGLKISTVMGYLAPQHTVRLPSVYTKHL